MLQKDQVTGNPIIPEFESQLYQAVFLWISHLISLNLIPHLLRRWTVLFLSSSTFIYLMYNINLVFTYSYKVYKVILQKKSYSW